MRSNEPVLGLDVGTSGVRLVGIAGTHASGSSPVLQTYAEVALPAGAAVNGEVVDVAAVGQAIAAAWRSTGLRSRQVRVGLAGMRVFVRTVELPAMPSSELAGAVRFCAQDHLPIALDSAVVDHHVLDSFTGEDGTAMVRVIVAAVHREPLERLMGAVSAAGLRVAGVDLAAFALVRALAGAESSEDGLPEAVVSVGAGLTTVVVHEGGVPRFVRTVAVGGETLTAAIAEDLQLSTDAAEAAKRGDPASPADRVEAAQRVVHSRTGTIVNEIQGSLHYWEAQSGRPVGRARLTGHAASTGDLPGRLQFMLGIPVETATLSLAESGGPHGPATGPVEPASAAVAAGLALANPRRAGVMVDFAPGGGHRWFDGRIRIACGAAAAAVAVLLGALTVFNILALSHDRSRLAAQEAVNESIQAQLGGLETVRRLDDAVETATNRLQGLLAGDVSWSRIFRDLAGGMPADVWLSSFSAQLNRAPGGSASAAPPDGATVPAAPSVWGTVSMTASGLNYRSVASWLERLPELPFLGELTIGSVTRANADGVVNFSSNAAITPAAASDRAATLLGAAR